MAGEGQSLVLYLNISEHCVKLERKITHGAEIAGIAPFLIFLLFSLSWPEGNEKAHR
jgi:hypothetical protein